MLVSVDVIAEQMRSPAIVLDDVAGQRAGNGWAGVGEHVVQAHLVNRSALVVAADRDHGVAIVPGAFFSVYGNDWIRFSYATPPERTKGALERLLQGLEALG